MKKLNKKIEFAGDTIEKFYIPCVCSCNCGCTCGTELYDTVKSTAEAHDANTEDSSEYWYAN